MSNDDSKRPIPGETAVLADLEGPGVVTHMWVTIAANELGWPRLLREAAAPAIPEIRKLQRIPRVQTAADLALRNIGAPVAP